MKEFGKKDYTHTIYINFENNVTVEDLFSYDLETKSLITGLELYSDQKIDPNNTLLIFNEIQEVSQALSAIKYFYENAPEYQFLMATGNERFVELLDQQNYLMINSFKQTYIDTLKQYYYVVGMLEAYDNRRCEYILYI